MGFKAITINTPSTEPAHIYSADDAALYHGMIGVDCVLDIGSKMAASIISNNLIRISDGACIIQGRFGRIPFGEYEDIIIENGTAGQKRNDIIVARFTTTGSGEIETYELDVLKGTPGAIATDPSITIGDLNAGNYIREMPLYRVIIDGLSITAITALFQIVPAIDKLNIIQTADGTGTSISLTDVSFTDGFLKTFVVKANNNGSATTINGKPLYKPGTTQAPKLTAGKAVTVWYSSSGDCFFIKASAEGNALAEHVLEPFEFSNGDDTGIPGTMPNRGNVTHSLPINGSYTISSGYHNGSGTVNQSVTTKGAQTFNPSTANQTISSGQYLTGTQTIAATTGTANVSDVLSGKTFNSGNGIGLTGNIPSKGAATITPSTANQTISAGQYLSGTQTILGDADLVASKLPEDVNLFGVQGTRSLGKKFASGSVIPGTSGFASMHKFGSSTSNRTYADITVMGLTFAPRVVIIAMDNITVTAYKEHFFANSYCIMLLEVNNPYAINSSTRYYFTSNGFVMPFLTTTSTVTWYAFE